MSNKTKIAPFLFTFIFLITGTVLGQEIIGFSFKSNKKKSTIPFELYNNLIVLPLIINDNDTVRFVLDTGVGNAIITDPKIGDLLGLKPVNSIKIRGSGEGDELEALVCVGNTMESKDIIGNQITLLVISEDLFDLPSYLGKEVYGLIGYDIFSRFVVSINYKTKLLRLHDPKNYKHKKKFTLLPMPIDGKKPYVNAKVKNTEGETIGVRLIIDTGASHTLSLRSNEDMGIEPPENNIPAHLGKGLSGDIHGVMARIPELGIDKFLLKGIVTSFPDENSYFPAIELTPNTARNGNLGAGALVNFKTVFDYSRGLLGLKKNKYLKKKSDFNMSGIVLTAEGPLLRNYLISNIFEGSPADRAGLQPGDEIWAVDTVPAAKYSLNDINLILSRKIGKKIALVIKRGNTILEKRFRLEQLL